MRRIIFGIILVGIAVSAVAQMLMQPSAESDALFAAGVDLYNDGKYREAIPLFAKSDSLDKAQLDSTSNRRDYSSMWLASCYYKLGDTATAASINAYYQVTPVDRRLTVKSDSLSQIGMEYYNQGDYAKAAEYLTQCAEIEKSALGGKHIWYCNSMNLVALCNANLGNYTESIRLGTEMLQIQEEVLGKTHIDCAVALDNLAQYSYFSGEYMNAISLGTEALHIQEKVLGKEHPDYVVALGNLALYESLAGNYTEAIRLGTTALQIQENVFGKDNSEYLALLNILIDFNLSLYNYTEAIRLETEMLQIKKQLFGKEHPDYATSLNNLATYNANLGNYQEAIRLGTEALDIHKKSFEKGTIGYATSLNNLANYNLHLSKYSDAIKLANEALNFINKKIGKNNPYYATTLDILANSKAQLDDYTEAIELETEALNIREKVLGKEHPDYASSLNNLGNFHSCIGNYIEAINLGTEALKIQEETIGNTHPDYATSLNNLATYNAFLGKYAEAIRFESEALNIREKLFGKEYPDYATSLNNLANYNSKLGNYTEAMHLGTEALNVFEKVFGKNHKYYIISLNNLADYNVDLGNYTEAERLGANALQICEKLFGKEHSVYATLLSSCATYNFYLEKYSETIRLETEALSIREKVLGKKHPDYITSLSNLASYNYYLGRYTDAIRLETEVSNFIEKAYGNDSPSYARSLDKLANGYCRLGNYMEAIRLETKALKIQETHCGKYDANYLTYLFNIANQNYLSGNYEQAKSLFLRYCNIILQMSSDVMPLIEAKTEYNDYKESLALYTKILEYAKDIVSNIEHKDITEIFNFCKMQLTLLEKLFTTKTITYEDYLGNLFWTNFDLGKYAEAKDLGIEFIQTIESKLGKEHPDYAITSSYISICNWEIGNSDATKYCVEATEALSGIVRRTFADLTARERNTFWDKYKAWFEGTIHGIAYDMPSDSLAENGYNGALMAKGLLLNSEMELSTLLKESGDEEVANIYNNLKNLRLQINKLYEMPIAERPLDTDSLERAAQGLERQLVQRSKVYGDYTANLVIDWKQVRQKLGSGEMAVEFVSFPLRGDSVMYAAYCLRKDMPSPKMVPLFEERQLTSIDKGLYFSSNALYNLIWKPLEGEMAGVTTVYFAPSGELYNIPIENLPVDGNTYNSDLRGYRRLSSTRQLALRRDGVEVARAAVYGGLKYDADTVTLANDNRKYRTAEPVQWSSRVVADSFNLRGGVNELPATKIEAEEIDKALKTARIDTKLYTDTIGTEASFKALSGSGVNALHIATHGFYWTEREATQLDGLAFLGTDMPTVVQEDKALTRSGLLLAGANTALKGLPLPDGIEDGVLTAKEIAGMDLRLVDLVALSACQTGLGEITGDGVFGLQRGFKKAGANTLLMSLWKVDDTATQLLMTQFYKNLLSGMGKYEALAVAQKYLRELEVEVKITPGKTNYQKLKDKRDGKQEEVKYKTVRKYAHPKYWAAFVLLDGVN